MSDLKLPDKLTSKSLYFKIAKEQHEYLGIRFFKTNTLSDTVIQVVVQPGQEKKGRGHTFGVYVIAKMTLFSNYLAMGYAIPCTEKEYKKAFAIVVEYLKP